jgi:hypothetical protein
MNNELKCWPTQREIATDLRCKPHSLKDWLSQLVSGSYLSIEKYGAHHNFRYTVLWGDGNSALPKWATRNESRIAETGNAKGLPRCPNGHAALPIQASRRVAQMGNLSNTNGVNSISKGESPRALSATDKIILEKDLERAIEARNKFGRLADYSNGSTTYKRIVELDSAIVELRKKKGVVA